jgi:hypothetical protein
MEITPAMTNEVFDALVASLRMVKPAFCPTCPHCYEAVDLSAAVTDENGNAVHETCYTKQLTDALLNRPANPAAD